MVNRKIDTFSRIVAFIVALAIAMLTVTLVHRVVISAETIDDPETVSESGDVSYYETDESVSEAPDGEDGIPPENSDEAPPETTDENSFYENEPNGGIMPYSDSEMTEDTGKKAIIDASGIIKLNKAEILTENQQTFKEGTNVKDGDRLSLNYEWYIDNDNKDYSKVIFELDITDQLKGIKLKEGTFTYSDFDGLKAIYYVSSYTDENGKTRTIMQINPTRDFGAGSKNRYGSIMLEGEVKLSDFADQENQTSNVTLEFFTEDVDVVAPSLVSQLYSQKTTVGSIFRGADGGYYQKYNVRVSNGSQQDAENTVILDIPGGLFDGGPQNIKISPENSAFTPTVVQETTSDGKIGYKINVGSVAGAESEWNHGYIDVTYDMKIDLDKALNPDLSDDEKQNIVSIERNDGQSFPSKVELDIGSFAPKIDKSGAFNAGNNEIVWTVTVYPNSKGDADFTVTDTLKDGETQIFSKSDFIPHYNSENELTYYTYTYTTPVDESTPTNTVFTNSAELKYTDAEYTYKCEANCTVSYDIGNFIEKRCDGLNGDKIGWTAEITVPQYKGNKNASISVRDSYASPFIYKGDYSYEDILRDSDINIEINGKNYTIDNGKIVNVDNPNDVIGTGNFTYNSRFEFTLNDLQNIAGKKIKITYKTGVTDGNRIDLIGKLENQIDCTVTYGNEPFADSQKAVYAKDFSVLKMEWSGNNMGATAQNLRNPKTWAVIIDEFNGLEDNVITFTDTLPDGYTFKLNETEENNPTYLVKYELADSKYGGTAVPLTNTDQTFNSDFTVMNGRIELTHEEAAKLYSGYAVRVIYTAQMSYDHYKEFNALCDTQEYTNNVSVINGENEIPAALTFSLTPDSRNKIDKTAVYNPNDNAEANINPKAEYTLYVNKEAVKLGYGDKLTVTDTLGYKLKFDEESSITIKANNVPVPNAKAYYTYDDETRTITFTLNNETAYEIVYYAGVKQLFQAEYSEVDGIDDARDKNIIHTLYTNNAVLSYSDGDERTVSSSYMLSNYRSQVTINSEFLDNSNDMNDNNYVYLKIKKEWDDELRQNKITHTEPVIVQLEKYTAGGVKVGKTIDVDTYEYDGEYYKIVQRLTKYDKDGNPYVYKVVSENPIPGYTFKAEGMNGNCDQLVSKITENGVETETTLETYEILVTNTYNPKPENDKINLHITKDWQGDNGHTGLRNSSVDFVLYRDGIAIDNGTLSSENNWEQIFYNLDKYSNTEQDTECNYTVVETTQNINYTCEVNDMEPSEGDADGNYTIEIVNTYDPKLPDEKVSITVEKKWKGDDGNTDDRAAVTFKLFKNGKLYREYTISGENDNGKWEKTIDDLPMYYEKDDGSVALCEYKIIETSTNNNYTAQNAEDNPVTVKLDPNNTKYNAVIANTYKSVPDDKISITVEKKWVDGKGKSVTAPKDVTQVEFQLKMNGGLYGKYSVSSSQGWKRTINNLDKYYRDADGNSALCVYEITEIVPKNSSYALKSIVQPKSGNGYAAVITNSYETDTPIITEPPVSESTTTDSSSESSDSESESDKVTEPPVSESKPESSDSKPTVSESKPEGSDSKPPVSESKPDSSDSKPPVSESKPEGSDSKPPVSESKPEGLDSKPSVSESKPAGSSSGAASDSNTSDDTTIGKNPDNSKPTGSSPNTPAPPAVTTTPISSIESTTNAPAASTHSSDTEDVSSSAGIFEGESDAVKRDTIMIFILVGIIVIGTSILVYRSKTTNYEHKHRM